MSKFQPNVSALKTNRADLFNTKTENRTRRVSIVMTEELYSRMTAELEQEYRESGHKQSVNGLVNDLVFKYLKEK